jgi:hypothetical protein
VNTQGKKNNLIIAIVSAVGLIMALYPATGWAAGKTEKEKGMELRKSVKEASLTGTVRKIPPIDLKVPAKVETATFALG